MAAWDCRYWEVADPSLLSEGVLVCVIPTDPEYAQLRCSLRSYMLICRAFSVCSFPFLIGGASIANVVNLLHFLAGFYKRRASPTVTGYDHIYRYRLQVQGCSVVLSERVLSGS